MSVTSIAFAAALALQAGALPADPQQGAAAKTPTIAAQSTDGGGVAAKPTPTRYCVVLTPTGTRMPRRECRTRQEWETYGFDPLAKD